MIFNLSLVLGTFIFFSEQILSSKFQYNITILKAFCCRSIFIFILSKIVVYLLRC